MLVDSLQRKSDATRSRRDRERDQNQKTWRGNRIETNQERARDKEKQRKSENTL